jgi:hypothetical protein
MEFYELIEEWKARVKVRPPERGLAQAALFLVWEELALCKSKVIEWIKSCLITHK